MAPRRAASLRDHHSRGLKRQTRRTTPIQGHSAPLGNQGRWRTDRVRQNRQGQYNERKNWVSGTCRRKSVIKVKTKQFLQKLVNIVCVPQESTIIWFLGIYSTRIFFLHHHTNQKSVFYTSRMDLRRPINKKMMNEVIAITNASDRVRLEI